MRDLALAGIFYAAAKYGSFLFLQKESMAAAVLGLAGTIAFLMIYAKRTVH